MLTYSVISEAPQHEGHAMIQIIARGKLAEMPAPKLAKKIERAAEDQNLHLEIIRSWDFADFAGQLIFVAVVY